MPSSLSQSSTDEGSSSESESSVLSSSSGFEEDEEVAVAPPDGAGASSSSESTEDEHKETSLSVSVILAGGELEEETSTRKKRSKRSRRRRHAKPSSGTPASPSKRSLVQAKEGRSGKKRSTRAGAKHSDHQEKRKRRKEGGSKKRKQRGERITFDSGENEDVAESSSSSGGGGDGDGDVPLPSSLPADETWQGVMKRRARRETFMLWELAQHTWHNIRASKVTYSLGCAACCVVVLTVALFMTIIGNTPVVMLRLAELEAGEIDIQGVPRETRGPTGFEAGLTLNYTLLSLHLEKRSDDLLESDVPSDKTRPDLSFSTARITGELQALAAAECRGGPPMEPTWKYNGLSPGDSCVEFDDCFDSICTAEFAKAELYLVDSEKEAKINLGRSWKLDAPKTGHCWMQSSMASNLGVGKGDIVYLRLNANDFFGNWWSHAIYPETVSPEGLLVSTDLVVLPITVEDTFADATGKYGSDVSNGIIMEYGDFLPFVAQHVNVNVPSEQRANLSRTDLFAYAREVAINLPSPRVEAYLSSDYDEIQNSVVSFASVAVYEAGFNQMDILLPVLTRVRATRFLGLFLGLTLNVVTVVLLVLAILLIYSLMMTSVETRTFELGVLRMVGMTRRGIVELLILQGFAYSIPAWAVGLSLAQGLSVIVMNLFEQQTDIPIDPLLTPDSIWIATVLGLVIPIISAILPIRTALTSNLHDALDTSRNKNKAVKMSVNRASSSRFSWSFLILGIGLAGFGFGIYYVMPLSLLSQNFFLLLNLFFLLLLGMLFGLTMLSLNFQHPIERILVAGMFWWEAYAVTKLVRKNLVAHRVRNRKTTVMFALSLGFIIFVLVSFSLTINSFTFEVQRTRGAFLVAAVPPGEDDDTVGGMSPDLQRTLELAAGESEAVEDWAWESGHLAQTISEIGGPILATNVGRAFFSEQLLATGSPSIMSATLTQFLDIGKVRASPPSGEYPLTPMQQAYTLAGSWSAVMGASYEERLGLENFNTSFLLQTEISDVASDLDEVYYDRLLPIAFMNAAPALTFSQFPGVQPQNAIVSSPALVRLSRGKYAGVQDLPWLEFLVKFKEGVTEDEISEVESDLANAIENYKEASNDGVVVEIWEYNRSIEPIQTATEIMTYFFYFVAVLAMLVAAFSLVSSMFTNIHEQSKEIGVMRAIGVTKSMMFRVYAYEGFVVVMSSSLMGFAIGVGVGYTMTIQRALFTLLPVPFLIPWTLLAIILVCSMFFAFLSSVLPLRHTLKLPIVHILRRT